MRLIAQLSGLDALSLKVSYLINAARDGLKLSVPEAAQMIVLEAQANVRVETGNLREHIHAESLIDEPETQVLQVAPFVEAGNKWGFDPAYARRIEYGFIGQDSLGRNYHQAAQPYMRPAADTVGSDALATIKQGVYDQLDAAMNQRAA